MNKKYFIVFLKCIGLQLIFSIVSVVFFVNIISPALYSIFTAWLLIWALHSTFWTLGNKEGKMIVIHNNNLKIGDTKQKKKIFKGALVALPFLLVNIIFLLLTYYTNNDILVFIETFITFSFSGFLPTLKDDLDIQYLISHLLVHFAMYIPCVIAYISGLYKFSLLDKYYRKILYKNIKQ